MCSNYSTRVDPAFGVRYEYKVEMEFSYTKDEPAAYLSATRSGASKPAAEPPPVPRPPSSDSDSDSD